MNNKFTMVCPAIPDDVDKLVQNSGIFFKYLPIDKICVIGPNKVQQLLPTSNHRFIFIDESTIVSFDKVAAILDDILGNHGRTGWYLQQFIKMSYSLMCEEDYYLLWDSDTIPLKKIEMFDNDGTPYFDMKKEYHKAYFDTIENIFGYKKEDKMSYISEHMIVKSSLMRDMIKDIQAKSEIAGDDYFEKILRSVCMSDLPSSGFSEFETFGTYCAYNAPNVYKKRVWHSMRWGGQFIDKSTLTQEKIDWLARNYNALSFEKFDQLVSFYNFINTKLFRCLFPSTVLDRIVFIRRIPIYCRYLYSKLFQQ